MIDRDGQERALFLWPFGAREVEQTLASLGAAEGRTGFGTGDPGAQTQRKPLQTTPNRGGEEDRQEHLKRLY